MSAPAIAAPVDALAAARREAREEAIVIEDVRKAFPVRESPWQLLARLGTRPRAPRPVRTVLAGVSLRVGRGECLGLLGPNGAGKTTLFRLLMGMVLPDAGRIAMHAARDAGQPVAAYASVDERSLYWRLDATENVLLQLGLYGVPRREARRRAVDALALVGLAHATAQPVGSFSSGMRQRLLLARALAIEPDVLLLDEPTRSLDPMAARDLRRFLRDEVVARRACTVLVATHSGDEATGLCDRVAILDRGRLVAVDAADALAARLGDARLRVWTDAPRHPAFDALARDGAARGVAVRGLPADGWTPVTLDVPAGDEGAARVLGALAAAGIAVARAEREPVGLAELIERLTAGEGR